MKPKKLDRRQFCKKALASAGALFLSPKLFSYFKYNTIAHEILTLEKEANVFAVLGDAYFRKQNYEKAIENLKKSIEIQPTMEVYNNLGVALRKLGKFEEAEEYFKKAEELY